MGAPLSRNRLYDNRYLLLLLAIVILVAVWPATGLVGHDVRWVRTVLFTFLLGAALLAARPGRGRKILIGLVAFDLLTGWLHAALGGSGLSVTSNAGAAAFSAVLIVLLLRDVLAPGRITGERIVAAVCAYLLLGLLWAKFYAIVHVVAPPAFTFPEGSAAINEATMTYFSFVTLTTLGYGDITPVQPVARSLALLEAAVGQLYVAILIARLVALQIAHASSGKRQAEDETA